MPRITDLPWFPFWAADFKDSREVRMMPAACVGLYVLMLAHQWTDGPLPNDPASVARLIGHPHADLTEHWPTLLRCFVVTGRDEIVNNRLEQERAKQQSRHERLVEGGRKGGITKAARRL